MNGKIAIRIIDFDHFDIRNLTCCLSCALALFPCLFSNLNASLGMYGILIIYLISVLLAVYSISPTFTVNTKMVLLWSIVALFALFNRNKDILNFDVMPLLHMLFLLYYALVFVAQDERFIRNMIRVLFLYLGIQIILGFYFLMNPDVLLRIGTQLFNLDEVFYAKFSSYIDNGAFLGLTSHYSTSGMYMALAVVLTMTFVLVYKNRSRKWNIFYLALFAVSFLALGMTQKRAHLLFAVAAMAAMYLIGYVNGNINKKIAQVIALIVLGVIAFLIILQLPAFQSVLARFAVADSLDEASSNRIGQLWLPALHEFAKHPLLGMGWRQFKYAYPMTNGVMNDVHNIYIQFFAENGIIGGICITALMAYTYVTTWKLLRKSKYKPGKNEYLYLMFSFGYQTFFLLYGLTGNPFYDIQCFFPYMICCGIAYLYKCKERENNTMAERLTEIPQPIQGVTVRS